MPFTPPPFSRAQVARIVMSIALAALVVEIGSGRSLEYLRGPSLVEVQAPQSELAGVVSAASPAQSPAITQSRPAVAPSAAVSPLMPAAPPPSTSAAASSSATMLGSSAATTASASTAPPASAPANVASASSALASAPPSSRECCVTGLHGRVCVARNVTLIFHDNALELRGTGVAMHDYADAWEELLCGTAYIYASRLNPAGGLHPHPGKAHFTSRFGSRVRLYDDWDWARVNEDADAVGASAIYAICGGYPETVRFRPSACSGVRQIVHAVFDGNVQWGDAFAVVSSAVHKDPPVVPHIVYLPPYNGTPGALRAELRIPSTATVFCRHGGWDSFDMSWVMTGICDALRDDDARGTQRLHFIFMNTKPLPCEHARLHYLGGTHVRSEKARFLDSCDACLHGTMGGETFGLSVGECALAGKPVLAYDKPLHHRHHLDTMGPLAVTFSDAPSFSAALWALNSTAERVRAPLYAAAYEQYSRENVMAEFVRVFRLNELAARAPFSVGAVGDTCARPAGGGAAAANSGQPRAA